MNRQIDVSENPESRSISRPTLILAIVLTVAWFSMLAIAIASTGNAETASAYGIDEFQPEPWLLRVKGHLAEFSR